MWLGRDTATLEVVVEAAGPLSCSLVEGLRALAEQVVAPSQAAGPSQLSVVVVVQLPMVVAT